jgi:hypothetical protein
MSGAAWCCGTEKRTIRKTGLGDSRHFPDALTERRFQVSAGVNVQTTSYIPGSNLAVYQHNHFYPRRNGMNVLL